MTSLRIVEQFDVTKNVLPCCFPIGVDFPANPFPFEKLKEALGNGVVVTVAAPAHAGDQVVHRACIAPRIDGIPLQELRRSFSVSGSAFSLNFVAYNSNAVPFVWRKREVKGS